MDLVVGFLGIGLVVVVVVAAAVARLRRLAATLAVVDDAVGEGPSDDPLLAARAHGAAGADPDASVRPLHVVRTTIARDLHHTDVRAAARIVAFRRELRERGQELDDLRIE